MIVEATEQEAERMLRRLDTPSVAARARADVKEFVESARASAAWSCRRAARRGS